MWSSTLPAAERVFPIRSIVSVESTPSPTLSHGGHGDHFRHCPNVDNTSILSDDRRPSQGSTRSPSPQAFQQELIYPHTIDCSSTSNLSIFEARMDPLRPQDDLRRRPLCHPAHFFNDISSARLWNPRNSSHPSALKAEKCATSRAGAPAMSTASAMSDVEPLATPRLGHVVSEGGHAVITGPGSDPLQQCEDEQIYIPGAIQGFGLLVAVESTGQTGILPVRIVSENSKRIIGRTPGELLALNSFTEIFPKDEADCLTDHIDVVKDKGIDVAATGPEVFALKLEVSQGLSRRLWCAVHQNRTNPDLIICELEMENDQLYPLVPPAHLVPQAPENTLNNRPTLEEFLESTEDKSRSFRLFQSAGKRSRRAAAMDVLDVMSQVEEQLAAASSLEKLLKVLVGIVKTLTGFHRVMIYQFDRTFDGRVVAELVDPRATNDLYKGLKFPASGIFEQAGERYKANRMHVLYDRELETARLVCRTAEDLRDSLDLTHSYLRAMSPAHLEYLGNMAVRSSMSISVNVFDGQWGTIACHSYGSHGMRVSFTIRKICRLVGDSASKNIERLSYVSRLQARQLINTMPTERNPAGCITALPEELLELFNADFALLSVGGVTKILGKLEHSQEALAILEYLKLRKIASVIASANITQDFPDLRYPPGFHLIAGMLVVPFSVDGNDFVVFFRKSQIKEVKWAGNPYKKPDKEGSEGYSEPRKSFKIWSETVVGTCHEWSEEELENAAVLCLVYGKFIKVWRQKEAALRSSQLTKLLLANSAHEVRTPLNAIVNYLEIALESSIDKESRDHLVKSHAASKSLIYVINDLLSLTEMENGDAPIKREAFNLGATLKEATDVFRAEAKRKDISYDVFQDPRLPQRCIGDQRLVRQAIANITANAIQNTDEGGVMVEMNVFSRPMRNNLTIEVVVTDTGVGMSSEMLDQLFYDLEQERFELSTTLKDALISEPDESAEQGKNNALGLGLAIVAGIMRNMNGQLRLSSKTGKGTRVVILFPFDLPDPEIEYGWPPCSSAECLTPQVADTSSTSGDNEERILIAPSLLCHDAPRNSKLARRKSVESLHSFKNVSSGRSHGSDIDGLIEAIQEPHLFMKHPPIKRSTSAN